VLEVSKKAGTDTIRAAHVALATAKNPIAQQVRVNAIGQCHRRHRNARPLAFLGQSALELGAVPPAPSPRFHFSLDVHVSTYL